MAVKVPNYYAVLGIQRNANSDEVRKAFRRMAQKYHPDINCLPYAEERFKQINEAYEVLRDPEKRKKYDLEAYPFQTTDRTTRRGPEEKSSFEEETNNNAFERERSGRFSKFFESFFNSAKKARDSFRTRAYAHPQRGSDLVAELEVTLEELYRSDIKSFELLFSRKNRLGKMVVKKKKYEIKLPKGTQDGTCIRLRGQGNNGLKGGASGDLYIKIKVLSHPYITVKDYDLSVDIPVAPYEVALGSWVKIPTLAGPLSIRLPAGTSSGRQMRLRGKGLPKKNGTHGDQYIKFVITIPTRLSDSEKRIYQALARVSKNNPRNES